MNAKKLYKRNKLSDGYYYQSAGKDIDSDVDWCEHICVVKNNKVIDGYCNIYGDWTREPENNIEHWRVPKTAKKISYKKYIALIL